MLLYEKNKLYSVCFVVGDCQSSQGNCFIHSISFLVKGDLNSTKRPESQSKSVIIYYDMILMLNMTSYTANANLLLVSIKGLRPFHVMGEEKTQRFFPRHPRPYFHTLPSEGTCKPNFGRRTCHRFVQQTAKIYSQLPKAMGTPPLPESTRGPSCSTR